MGKGDGAAQVDVDIRVVWRRVRSAGESGRVSESIPTSTHSAFILRIDGHYHTVTGHYMS